MNEVYDDLGAAQSRLNATEAALASFRKALEGDSADPDYHFNLGYTLVARKAVRRGGREPARSGRARPERHRSHGCCWAAL